MFRANAGRFPPLQRPGACSLLALGVFAAASTLAQSITGLTATPLAPPPASKAKTLFVEITPEESGVRTENKYADPKMWSELYHEFEIGPIGTGVAIGDFDNDGRADVFVVSKTESCRLFRNLGGWRFEDVSERAGVADRGAAAAIWKQGATFADVNNDGWLDLYVCRFNAPNLLYLNQRDGTFRESARAAGLDVVDSSLMAAFADYDRDGWLDVFLQTNLLDNPRRPGGQRDYLFRNKGDGTFQNVTAQAGLDGGETQGNSAAWWDYDDDGWPDLYVANDFAAPDRLYQNNGDGTFTNVIDDVVPHVPYSSMGTDVGDINNDGLFDLLATDMAATSHEKDQRSMADTRGRTKDPAEGSKAIPNYLRNSLFLNTGTGRCLEVAHLAGLAATDWTWSVRFEDFDNDGRVDLHVTNGMHREIHNTDLLLRMMATEGAADRVRAARNSPVLSEPNLAYRNLGDLQFEETGAAWGLNQRSVSFGAATGDLDGDGDLDLIFSNYEAGATVLRNEDTEGNRVVVALRGLASNRFGIGATVRIETATGVQARVVTLARGYMSSSEPIAHFGLGDESHVARLTVRWPSGHAQVFENLAANTRYTITEPAGSAPTQSGRAPPSGRYIDVTGSSNLSLRAAEEIVDEIGQQRLLPVRLNRRGPALAAGDIDGDGRDDLVFGGTTLDPARILLDAGEGRFTAIGRIAGGGAWSSINDGPVLLFDANGDGRTDILVTKGGNSLPAGSPEYQPLLLFGASDGLRPAAGEVLPPIAESIGAAAAADFDRDGRLDVFLGGRVSPGLYPLAPRSMLLRNEGGRFVDATDAFAPALREIGMVTSALWTDVDRDGWPDLLVAIEWGEIRYLHNASGRRFEDWTERAGFAAAGTGWWTALASADFNRDGKPDYVAGNAGLNTPYRASPERPTQLFVSEHPDGGAPRLIEAYYEGDTLYPRRSRKELAAIFPAVARRFPRNDVFARASLEQILGAETLSGATRFTAAELRSGVFLSQPDGRYRFQPLPRLAQVAPFQGVATGDFDGDGFADIYAVQNSYAPSPVVGRFDGGLSQLLCGDGSGGFRVMPHADSGLIVPGDAKAVVVFDLDDDSWPDFVLTRNGDSSVAFRNLGAEGRNPLRVTLAGPEGNPTAIGAWIDVELSDGDRQSAEVCAGAGWMSQSAPAAYFGFPDGNPPRWVTVRWPDGRVSRHEVQSPTRALRLSAP
jgi:enediyne biosynthesis protein E4